jgi:hypothetical protein
MLSIGLGAIYSVAHTDNFMYWLGDDRQVYRLASGGGSEQLSTSAIAYAMENYTTVDDAVGWVMTLSGQKFYVLTFPSANKTWVVNEAFGNEGWFELSADTLRGRYNATSHLYLYCKHLLAD